MRKLLDLIFILLFICSCDTRRDIFEEESVWVRFHIDWSEIGILPDGTTVWFYPERADLEPIHFLTNYLSDSVKLHKGIYKIVLFNETIDGHKNIIFKNTHSYESIEAHVKSIEVPNKYSKASGGNTIAYPDIFGVSRLENFEITRQMIEIDERPTLNFTPKNKIIAVRLVAHIKGMENIAQSGGSIGSLSGMTGVINLSKVNKNHTPSTHYYNMNHISFSSTTKGTMSSIYFNTFGPIRADTLKSENIRNIVTLHLLLRNGDDFLVERDVTDLIDIAIAKNNKFSLELGLGVQGNELIVLPDVPDLGAGESGFDANVDDWDNPIIIDTPI